MPRTASLGLALRRWLRSESGEQRSTTDDLAPNRQPQPQPTPIIAEHEQAPWYKTLWLTGVDYFSSLGYAPGLAFLAAGWLSPIATLLLVAVTFLAAVPVYSLVAKHSPNGEGSIKMIERLTTGWGRLGWLGKTLVLILLGFAMTDFVITVTLSAADATLHILENPFWPKHFPQNRLTITWMLIVLLGLVFLKGFREAIGLAQFIALPFMLLNAIIIGAGARAIILKPELFEAWLANLQAFDATNLRNMLNEIDPMHALDPLNWLQGQGTGMLVTVCLLVFPKLALGLSGFETSVSVMPLIRAKNTAERARNTKKLLITAASMMSVALLGSSFVTAVLIPPSEFATEGSAHGRALAFIAHQHIGETFGTLYDAYTVAILWFAGASAMAGLLNIIPRYLPRFGMSPYWLEFRRPMVLIITFVCLMVTWIFDADVEVQGGAYATGVLVLMASGALAVLLAEWDSPTRRMIFGAILLVFGYVLVVNVVERPDGLRIAGVFIIATISASVWSRWRRVNELRVQAFAFTDPESERIWNELKKTPDCVVIPLRTCDAASRRAAPARSLLHLEVEKRTVPCFLHIELTEDPSNFMSPIKVKARREGNDVVINVTNAVAVANAIAYVALEINAEEVVIGLLDSGTPVVNALMYLFFGTGEVGYGVRSIFMKIREQRLSEEMQRRKEFDRLRDQREQDLLRKVLDVPPEERAIMTNKLFEEEAELFKQVFPENQPKMPRLILVG